MTATKFQLAPVMGSLTLESGSATQCPPQTGPSVPDLPRGPKWGISVHRVVVLAGGRVFGVNSHETNR